MGKRKQLLIISDSPMWKDKDGKIQVFEPTLREIEKIQESLFDSITWIGFEHPHQRRNDGRSTKHAIVPVLLPASGGKTLMGKIKQFFSLPFYFMVIFKHLLNNQYIHTRGPSIPALMEVLLSFLWPKKTYWHKYAGNWVQENPPLSYVLQRTLLKKARHAAVTVNGKWGDEGKHIKAFENPCLTQDMIEEGRQYAIEKVFNEPLKLCFVGRIEEAKGVKFILEGLKQLPAEHAVQRVQFIGSGPHLNEWEKAGKQVQGIDIQFQGSLDFTSLIRVYRESHALLLPSTASEGFPKVIAEAAAYGCLPVVSGISSITQYVRHQENGLVIEPLEPYKLVAWLEYIHTNPEQGKAMALAASQMAEAFTFQRFTEKLKQEVFHFDE